MDFYHSPVAVWVNSAPQPKRWGPRAHRGMPLPETMLTIALINADFSLPAVLFTWSWVSFSNNFLVTHRVHFKNTYELVTLGAPKISLINKLHIFQCMGNIFCVEFQREALKFHTKYLTHRFNETFFIRYRKLKSSQIYELVSVFAMPSWVPFQLEQIERLRSEIPPTTPWLPILVIHIRSQVKTRLSLSCKFWKIAKN